MADAVTCAKAGQKVPEGYYNAQLMLGKIVRSGEVLLCGTCMDVNLPLFDVPLSRSIMRPSIAVPQSSVLQTS